MQDDGKRYGLGLANAQTDEERRLAAAEELFDTTTFRHLDALGLKPGMRCLEVGAGTGSVGRFLADRVGDGTVVITDIDTTQLRGCDEPSIEVREHDIRSDPLEEGHYDVVHARLLLEHLPERLAVLDKLVASLRPGGWLLIEDVDMSNMAYLAAEHLLFEPSETGPSCQAITVASVEAGAAFGLDYTFGRDLPRHLRQAGLDEVDAEVTSRLVVGGSTGAVYYQLLIPHLRLALRDRPDVSEADFDTWEAALRSPDAMFQGLSMVSAWGQRRATG